MDEDICWEVVSSQIQLKPRDEVSFTLEVSVNQKEVGLKLNSRASNA